MNVSQFLIKWRQTNLTERSGAQQHFCDLCDLLNHPKPAEMDPQGEFFTFEKGASKHSGGEGWADVWKRGFFAFEYKGKHKDLDAAYNQLLQYREALENPPILAVCDMDRIVVHTNFTGTAPKVYDIRLLEFDKADNLEILRAVFRDPDKLKPGATREGITREAAERLAVVADRLRHRGLDPHKVARFLDRIVFCLFAEDIGLLPEDTFTHVIDEYRNEPEQFTGAVGELFAKMATGGRFGSQRIRHFNGDLFADVEVLELEYPEMESLYIAAKLDWAAVDATIFGTLFERGMDPAKRAQFGAHYTSRADIETLVEPVVMAPLRREWAECRQTIESRIEKATPAPAPKGKKKEAEPPAAPLFKGQLDKATHEAEILINRFLQRLAKVHVLDPACGSGNFLYVALQKLEDLEKEVVIYAAKRGFGKFDYLVGPWQLHGIEKSSYAFELAQLTVWIGYLQWLIHNGCPPNDPVLRPIHTFECKDAILDLSDPEHPKEPEWPKVDFIVGNPPFLGDKKMRGELGDGDVEALRGCYGDRLPAQSDLCCYWFEKARNMVEEGKAQRAGLLATQGIRSGANREVLKRIKTTGEIFFAVSDRPWILEGASVHVSLIGFDDGRESQRLLDGRSVVIINSDLTGGDENVVDTTRARQLSQNAELCFLGVMKAGAFDIPEEIAREMLKAPNPNGKPNSDVIRPRLTARDILQRTGLGWILDFGCTMGEAEACLYEAPWEYVLRKVKPERVQNRRKRMAARWWIHGEPRPGLRRALSGKSRFIVTPEVSKHRIFCWLDAVYLADHKTRAFPTEEEVFFGVLHSRIHEVWSLRLGTQLRERESGFSYTPTTCFETFPFPHPTPDQESAIAEAAKGLNELREGWLNPTDWVEVETLEFPGSVEGPWAAYLHDSNERGVGTVRYPRLVPRDASCAQRLKKRTLTNLYNQRPTWLALAHQKLDAAVFAAYGWDAAMGNEEILDKLLALNLERAAAERAGQ